MAVIKNFEVVDKLAAVNAEIARLTDEAADLKAKIIMYGFPVIETEKYKAVVSMIEPTKVVDYKAVCTALKVSPELLAKFSKEKAGYARVALYDL